MTERRSRRDALFAAALLAAAAVACREDGRDAPASSGVAMRGRDGGVPAATSRAPSASAVTTGAATSDAPTAADAAGPPTRAPAMAVASGSAANPPAAPIEKQPATPDVTPPTAPLQIEARAASPSRIDLLWTASTDDVGVAGYEVFRGDTLVATEASSASSELGLEPWSEYCYRVRAFDAAGHRSAFAGPVCARTLDVRAPTAPERLVGTLVSPAEISLEWRPSADDVGVAGYEVLRGASVVARTSGTRLAQSGLAPAVRQCFTVRAVDAAGNRSEPSGAACVIPPDVTPPTVPAGLSAAARSGDDVALAWAASTDDVGVAGYEVLRGEIVIASVKRPAAADRGLQAAREYCYSVRAYDAAGNRSGRSPAACVVPPDTMPPSVPGGLEAEAQSEQEIVVRWQPSSDDVGVAGYDLLRGDAIVASVAHASAREGGLRAATEYCYAVRARDAAGNRSKLGGPVCARTLDTTPPSVPGAVAAVAASDRKVDVSWKAASDNVGVSGYEVFRGERLVARTAGLSAAEAGLAPAARYCYGVVAVDAAGNRSGPSALACATTPDRTPPTKPGDLAVEASSSTQLVVGWSPSRDDVGVAGYELIADGRVVASGPRTDVTVTGLAPLAESCFEVRAYDAAGNRSEAAGPVCGRTADPALLPAPTRLQAKPGNGAVVLTWNPAPRPGLVYVVFWDGDARIGATGSTTFTVKGRAAAETHCYRVAAVDADGHESAKALQACARAKTTAASAR